MFKLEEELKQKGIGLSIRALTCLRKAKINTIEELKQVNFYSLLEKGYGGRKTLIELTDCLYNLYKN